MNASELYTRRALYVLEVSAGRWVACYMDGPVWDGGWFDLGEMKCLKN